MQDLQTVLQKKNRTRAVSIFAPQPGLEWRGVLAIATKASRPEPPFINGRFGMYEFGESLNEAKRNFLMV